MMLLTGCSGTISSCPKLFDYTDSQQDAAAIELKILQDVLGPDPMLGRMMVDYATTRDQLRHCQ